MYWARAYTKNWMTGSTFLVTVWLCNNIPLSFLLMYVYMWLIYLLCNICKHTLFRSVCYLTTLATCQLLRSHSIGDRRRNEHGVLVKWYVQRGRNTRRTNSAHLSKSHIVSEREERMSMAHWWNYTYSEGETRLVPILHTSAKSTITRTHDTYEHNSIPPCSEIFFFFHPAAMSDFE
jgi:hypothetical protein